FPAIRQDAAPANPSLLAKYPSGVSASHSKRSPATGAANSVMSSLPAGTSQSRTRPSNDPDATSLLSGLIATAYTMEPTSTDFSAAPVFPFQRRTVLSAPAEAMSLPSLLKQISCTAM